MGVQTMTAFGSMFPKEEAASTKAKRDYDAAVAASAGSAAKLKEARLEYERALSSIASATLKRDRKLKLDLPFILDNKTKKQIESNVPYYLHEEIIHPIKHPCTCLVCGKKQQVGQVMITVAKSAGEATCLGCTDTKEVDNKNYILTVLQ